MDGLRAPQKRAPKILPQKSNKIIKNNKENMLNKKSVLNNFISIAVTAAIVGGVIFAWQDRAKVDSLTKVQQDAKNTRESFEKSLKNLENKIRVVEGENEGLKSENDNLKTKAELINGAVKMFSNNELGLNFSYPAIFGETAFKIGDGISGEKFAVNFSLNNSFYLSGVTSEFSEEKTSTSTELNFDNFVKFSKSRDKYTATFSDSGKNVDYEVKPAEVIGFSGGEALLVDKNSFIVKDGQANISIGQNVGALLNTKKDALSGVALMNSDFSVLPLEDFKNILKGIEVK